MKAHYSASMHTASHCGNAAAYSCARQVLIVDTAIAAAVSISICQLPLEIFG